MDDFIAHIGWIFIAEVHAMIRHKLKGKMTKYWLFNSKKVAPNLRDMIDYDSAFIASLSEEDRKFLHDFCDGYYTGKKNDVSKKWDISELRECYTRNNKRVRSIHNQSNRYSLKAIERGTNEC